MHFFSHIEALNHPDLIMTVYDLSLMSGVISFSLNIQFTLKYVKIEK